jgi:hypothetical protein
MGCSTLNYYAPKDPITYTLHISSIKFQEMIRDFDQIIKDVQKTTSPTLVLICFLHHPPDLL